MQFVSKLGFLAVVVSAMMTSLSANALCYTLDSSDSYIGPIGGNTSDTPLNGVPFLYKINRDGSPAETGPAKDTFSGSFSGGNLIATILFNGPSPDLTYVALKAGNRWVYWNVSSVDFSLYDCIQITNDGILKNPQGNASQAISHISLWGTEGTPSVPDGGSLVAMLGLALTGMGLARRRSS
ncbi:MAG: hypothetical protein JNK85_00395 [Verrucomicrobiales bacterium]|nr:hypothetical protein [Verrucomicrobiales bacterium]